MKSVGCLVVCVVFLFHKSAYCYIESLAANNLGSLPDDFQGKVAFACDKGAQTLPAMVWTTVGWKQDDSETQCLRDEDQILAVCRRVYPGLNIMNVEPDTDHVIIENWCAKGQKTCRFNKRKVRPYICMHTPYQAPSLLISRNCQFKHKTSENPKMADNCHKMDDWHQFADNDCAKISQKIDYGVQKIGLLLPCDFMRHAGYFAGVEFTCCPKMKKPFPSVKLQKVHKQMIDLIPRGEKVDAEVSNHKIAEEQATYQDYFRVPFDYSHKEHERFAKAKEGLKHLQHLREQSLEGDLRGTEEKLLKLMPKSPNDIEKLLEGAEGKYKKLFHTLSTEEQEELHKLDEVHQERVLEHHQKQVLALKKVLSQMVQNKDRGTAQSTLEKFIRLITREVTRSVNRIERLSKQKKLDKHEVKKVELHVRLERQQLLETTADVGLRGLLGLDVIERLLLKYEDILKRCFTKLKVFVDKYGKKSYHDEPKVNRFEQRLNHLLELYHQQNQKVYNAYRNVKDQKTEDAHLYYGNKIGLATHRGDHSVGRLHGEDISGAAVIHHHNAHRRHRFSSNAIILSIMVGVSILLAAALLFVIVKNRKMCVNCNKNRPTKNGYHLSLATADIIQQDPKKMEPLSFGEDKNLQKFMLNGYENPTYQFYEK